MKQVLGLLLLASVFITGCGPSTKLINSWSDKENTPKQFDNIGVTVLFPSSSSRYITEHNIVEDLKKKGLNAMPTTDVFPMAGRLNEITQVMDDSDVIRKKVIEKVKENNIDALMIITLFDKTKEERWVNDRSYMMGGTGYYGTPYGMRGAYYDYYYYSVGAVYNDGYYVDDITYFIECNLYDAETEQLIWRAQTKSINPTDIEEASNALAYIISKQLLTKKVVSK